MTCLKRSTKSFKYGVGRAISNDNGTNHFSHTSNERTVYLLTVYGYPDKLVSHLIIISLNLIFLFHKVRKREKKIIVIINFPFSHQSTFTDLQPFQSLRPFLIVRFPFSIEMRIAFFILHDPLYIF